VLGLGCGSCRLKKDAAVFAFPDATSTWTYLNPLANTDMVEFGYTLPLPGHEAQWIQDKPTPLRDRLLTLNEIRSGT
jgi:hypothetical protein